MPAKYELTSLELVLTTAESLKKSSEQLVQVATDMQQHGMQQALFPWTQRQWSCLDAIITLTNQCLAVLPSQVTAKTQGRPSHYEITKTRSRKITAEREVRVKSAAAEKAAATAKKNKKPAKKKQ